MHVYGICFGSLFLGLVFVDTANANAKQYQECNTLVTRIEVRIIRLKEKGEKTKGALQATR